MDRKNFIERSLEKHGDKYDYSEIPNKITTRDKVNIKCKSHGIFNQRVSTHLSGSGCPSCHFESINPKRSKGREKFIEDAIKVHGNKYNYSEVNYINNETPVSIICPNHGKFEQPPRVHIFKKSGCKECKRVRFPEIINRSKSKHNNFYDYSISKYDDNNTVDDSIDIICPAHGKFRQRVKSHMMGIGCPYCKESKGEKFIERILIDMGFVRNIDYFREHKFEDCKNKRPLPFDFYLPIFNLCIEYDGLQHQKIIKHFGGFDSYENRLRNDNIKNIYCEQRGINLVRFFGNDYQKIENDIKKLIK